MSTASGHPLLVSGGDADPNLRAFLAAARRRDQPVFPLLIGKDSHPAIVWEVDSGRLFVDGERLECGAAFIRHDVFTALGDGQPSSQYRALAWYTALTGWLAARPEIAIFNRRCLNQLTNKPLMLHLAQAVGLAIPQTVTTNDFLYLDKYEGEHGLIVKPINGGGYCQDFREVANETEIKDGRAAAPAIVQHRLVPPEVRIYAIAQRYFAFRIISNELDYRATRDCRVEYMAEFSDALVSNLGCLLDLIGLDFAAADFKTCPRSSQLMFLEVNTAPMFAVFDQASEGRLCDAMLTALTDKCTQRE